MELKEITKGSQEWPVISCVIYTYNRAHVLPRAIKSVLDQTYKNFELIIVDDCSTDNTWEVVRGFHREEPKRIIYHRNEKNLGSSANKNVGIDMARGRFIIILDDTKTFEPSLFQEAVDLLEGSLPIVGGVRVGRVIVQDGYKDYAPPITHTGFDSIDWGFMMKHEVFETCRYDENINGDEDADFGIQFWEAGWKTLPIDKPLTTAYATYTGSNSAPTPRRLKGLEYFIKKNLDYYKKDRNELRYLYRLAGRNFYKVDRLKGIKYFWLSFWAKKNLRTFLHFFFILFGWKVYEKYMNWRERVEANIRIKEHGLK